MPDIQDELFGALKWNDRFSRYEAERAQADGTRVLVKEGIKDADPTKAICRARAMYEVIRQHEPEYREAAMAKLLDLNDESGDDADTLDAEAFLTRVRLASLVIQVPGGARVYYNAGGYLEGHQIVVVLAENSTIRTVTIEG